jgi:hypothetical protein
MLTPLKQFICDSCGEIIQSPEQGWIEWLVKGTINKDATCSNFRICHHKSASPYEWRHGCYNYATHPDGADMHLNHYYDGKKFRIGRKPFHTKKRFEGIETSDKRALTILRLRLECPYYEEARLYLDKARKDNFLPMKGDEYIINEEVLKCVIEEYNVWL